MNRFKWGFLFIECGVWFESVIKASILGGRASNGREVAWRAGLAGRDQFKASLRLNEHQSTPIAVFEVSHSRIWVFSQPRPCLPTPSWHDVTLLCPQLLENSCGVFSPHAIGSTWKNGPQCKRDSTSLKSLLTPYFNGNTIDFMLPLVSRTSLALPASITSGVRVDDKDFLFKKVSLTHLANHRNCRRCLRSSLLPSRQCTHSPGAAAQLPQIFSRAFSFYWPEQILRNRGKGFELKSCDE